MNYNGEGEGATYRAMHSELLRDLLVEQLLHDASIASVDGGEQRYRSILQSGEYE